MDIRALRVPRALPRRDSPKESFEPLERENQKLHCYLILFFGMKEFFQKLWMDNKEFFFRTWYDNLIGNYFIIIGIILLVLLVKKYLARSVAGLLYQLVHSIWKDVSKKAFINLVARPLGFFLAI